jgi:hypothetical protein
MAKNHQIEEGRRALQKMEEDSKAVQSQLDITRQELNEVKSESASRQKERDSEKQELELKLHRAEEQIAQLKKSRDEAIEGRKTVEKELMTKEQESAELRIIAETMRIATELVIQEPTNVPSSSDKATKTSPTITRTHGEKKCWPCKEWYKHPRDSEKHNGDFEKHLEVCKAFFRDTKASSGTFSAHAATPSSATTRPTYKLMPWILMSTRRSCITPAVKTSQVSAASAAAHSASLMARTRSIPRSAKLAKC